MTDRALAIANNDIVYLWWTVPEKIDGCLGFSIHRMEPGRAPIPLPAFVGFDATDTNRPKNPDTDLWPIQSFQWKDVYAPKDRDLTYEILPMVGSPGALQPLAGRAIRTNPVRVTSQIGRLRVVFNRGLISTQAIARQLPKGKGGTPSKEKLKAHIEEPGDKIRKALAGQMIEMLTGLIKQADREGGRCFCALYELTDEELLGALMKSKRVEVILSNADSSEKEDGKTKKVKDGTNKRFRARLRKAIGNRLHDRILTSANAIGHNKFVVYADKGGQPRSVLTGSTNWTPTGLCAQTNNAILIESDAIASHYLAYWNRLKADKAKQGKPLREWDADNPRGAALVQGQGQVRVWFSPNTLQKTKPKDPETPPDMREVFEAITQAKQGVLFLLFNAGAPSILQHLVDVADDRRKRGAYLYVRGAVSDAQTAKQYTTRVYNRSMLDAPNELITGVGGVPDQYSYWEKELYKMGHAVIHDKVVAIDPFTDDCVVVTGSHNLGFKASYSNDENLCIVRGNRKLAEAYAAHVLDVVNHFNWRNKLEDYASKGELEKAWKDLDETDRWENKYFSGNFLASRDRFFFGT